MTSDVSRLIRRAGLAIVLLDLLTAGAGAAEPLPFEGTWVRANRACTANAPHARTYTAHEVTSQSSHCVIRKIASGSGQFELFEECRRPERPPNYIEMLKMLGGDAMVVRRQITRLKIARPLRFIRCSIAAPGAPKSPPPPHHTMEGAEPAAQTTPGAAPAPKPAAPRKP